MIINGAKVDTVNSDKLEGLLTRLKANGGGPEQNWEKIKELRANAKLPDTAGTWEDLDEEVIRAYEEEAKLTQDIRDQGLTTNHNIGDLLSGYRRSSLMTDANIDMTGEEMDDEDRVDYDKAFVPVPVIHKEFRIGWRESANNDTTSDNVAEATRAVTRALESLVWGGTNFEVGGNALNGVKDSGTSGDWGGSGAWSTASNAYSEVINAMDTLDGNGFGPPYNLYVDRSYYADLKGLRSNTTEDYLSIIEGLDEINAVRFSNNAESNKAYLVSMSRRSIDWAISQWITPVSWDIGPNGRSTQHQVFAVAAPRLKKDSAGNEGVNINTDISS